MSIEYLGQNNQKKFQKIFETTAGIEGLCSLKTGFCIFDWGQMCQLRSILESQMTKWSLKS